MKKRRFLKWTLAGAAGFFALLWLLDKSGVLVRALKPQAEKALATALDRPVEIGSVSGGLFGTIHVSQLKVPAQGGEESDYSLDVPGASIRFSLWNYFVLRKGVDGSLQRLDLSSPRLLIISGRQSSPFDGLPLPPLSFGIEDGSVALDRGQGEEALLDGLELGVKAGKHSALAEFSGILLGGSLKGKARLQQGRLMAEGSLKGCDLGRLKGFPSITQLDAQFTAAQDGTRVPELSFLYQGARFSGEAEWKDELKASLKSRDQALPWMGGPQKELDAEFLLRGGRLEVPRLEMRSAGELRLGAAFSMEGKSITASARFDAYPLPPPYGGTLGGKLLVEGALPELSATARVHADLVKLGGISLSLGVLSGTLSGGRFQLQALGSAGDLKGLTLSAQGHFNGLSLSAERISLRHPQATFAGSFKAAPGSPATGEGVLEAQDLLPWLKATELEGRLKGRLSARLKLDAKGLGIKADGEGLVLAKGQPFPLKAELSRRQGHWELSSLSVRRNEVSAEGDWGLPGDRLRLAFKAASLPLLLQLAGAEGKKDEGLLSGGLELGWHPKSPSFTADLKARSLRRGAFEAGYLALKFKKEGGKLSLEKLDASQDKGGKLEARGDFDPAGASSARAEWRQWAMGGRTLGGQFEAQSGQSRWRSLFGVKQKGGGESGDFKFHGLKSGEDGLPEAQGHWSLRDGRITLTEISFAGLRGGFSHSNGWSSFEASADGADPAPLLIAAGYPARALTHPLKFQLKGEGGRLSGSAKLALREALDAQAAWGESGVSAAAELKDLDLGEAAEWALLSGDAEARRQAREWQGKLKGRLTYEAGKLSFSAKAFSLKQGTQIWSEALAEGSYKKGELTLAKAWLGPPLARLALSQASLKKDPEGRFSAQGSFEAENFPEEATFAAGGEGRFQAQWKGSEGSLSLDYGRLLINQAEFQDSGLSLSWKDRVFMASESADPPHWNAKFSLPKDALWEIHSAWAQTAKDATFDMKPVDDEDGKRYELSSKGTPLALISKALGWDLDLEGRVWGNGVWRVARQGGKDRWIFSTKVEQAKLVGFPIDLATGQFKIENGILDFDAFKEPVRLRRQGRFDAEVTGKVPLDGGEVDLKGRLLSGNLGLLDYQEIIDSASGTVTAEFSIKGTAKYPEYSGKAEVHGGEIRFKRLLAPAKDVQIRLFIDNNKLDLMRCDMEMGALGQRLYLKKGPQGDEAVLFDRWAISKLNLKLESGKAGIHLRNYPNYSFVEGEANIDLLLAGDWKDPTFQGRVGMLNALVTWPPDKKGPQPPDHPGDFTNRMLWDLMVRDEGKVNFINEVVRAELKMLEPGLRVFGTGNDLMLQGKLRPLRGKVSWWSADFDLLDEESNLVEFRKELPPFISIWGRKEVRSGIGSTARVKVHAVGELGQIKVELSSDDPELNRNEAEMAAIVGIGSRDTRDLGPALGKSLVFLGSKVIKGVKRFDVSVRAPQLFGSAALTPGTTPVNLTGGTRVDVEIGTYLPDTNIYVKGGVEGKDTGTDYKGSIERPLSDKVKIKLEGELSSTDGNSGKIGLESSSTMDNYDPKKRREEIERKKRARLMPTPTPSPIP